jgi:hypothetical protein
MGGEQADDEGEREEEEKKREEEMRIPIQVIPPKFKSFQENVS